MDALLLHRIHFAFTVTFHYLFPQLTMGLALLIVVLKTIAIRCQDERYNQAARFWAKIFAINFVLGVVTGIPMEFQFGTNWSQFARRTGGVIGQPLAMEGVFSFFLESAFLGLFLFGEKRLSAWAHWGAAFLVFVGSWISGFFIIVTDAWMQHPVAYRLLPNGTFEVTSFWGLLLNPWACCNTRTTCAARSLPRPLSWRGRRVLRRWKDRFARHTARSFSAWRHRRRHLLLSLQIFPTGDLHGTLHGQESARSHGRHGRPLPLRKKARPWCSWASLTKSTRRIDNPLAVNNVLSFLIYGTTSAEVEGLDQIPARSVAPPLPLLSTATTSWPALGLTSSLLMVLAAFLALAWQALHTRWILWPLLLSFPLPYIANTAGWMTAEIGRQPWVVYGLMRTAQGYSKHVSAGNSLFTLLGFLGMYSLLSVLFIVLVYRIIEQGPRLQRRSPVSPSKAYASESIA